MPNDPTLYPSIPNPQQQQIQRTASLEARVAALEAKRDIYITAISELTGQGTSWGGATGNMTFPWYGGKLWVMIGGRFYTNSTWSGGTFSATVKINGISLAPAPLEGWAAANAGGTLGLSSYTNPSGLTRGTNTLTVAVPPISAGGVDLVFLNGAIIEWPQS